MTSLQCPLFSLYFHLGKQEFTGPLAFPSCRASRKGAWLQPGLRVRGTKDAVVGALAAWAGPRRGLRGGCLAHAVSWARRVRCKSKAW